MRTLALVMVFAAAGAARADDAAKSIIEKALKATGWEKRASEHATWKDKGKFSGGSFSADYEGTFHISYPDRLRFDMEIKADGQMIPFSVGLNGDKGWEKSMGTIRDITGDKLDYLKGEAHALHVFSLRTLLTDKDFTLKKIDDASVDGKKCVGVSVTKKDKPEIKLWFDAESGLPAKLEYKVKNEFDGWKEATDEIIISDWSDETNGKSFKKMKINRNGKAMIEAEVSDHKVVDKVDAKLYDKPTP